MQEAFPETHDVRVGEVTQEGCFFSGLRYIGGVSRPTMDDGQVFWGDIECGGPVVGVPLCLSPP